ncbi:DUF1697 domain-containing protein [Enterococcus sp.]|uniref:DUF1697 domain-containing protein n=1 Tax=Enterococcus sp. TaxID=35783 RepID=UPI002FC927E9
MIYVALLRGINVGGNNKIKMAELKIGFESLGFQNVTTYLHSGNIVFQAADETKKGLALKIEAMIQATFDLMIPVLIRDSDDIEAVIVALPSDWKNDPTMKSDVLFLWEEVEETTLLEQLKPNPTIDTVYLIPGTILWMVARENVNKSRLKQLVSHSIYKKTTVRNVNTTRKIADLMKNLVE